MDYGPPDGCVLNWSVEYQDNQLVLADATAVDTFRTSPIVVVDNVFVKGRTINSLAAKLLDIGASEIHLCIMSRWLGQDEAIRAAKEFRSGVCPDPAQVDQWYRNALKAH